MQFLHETRLIIYPNQSRFYVTRTPVSRGFAKRTRLLFRSETARGVSSRTHFYLRTIPAAFVHFRFFFLSVRSATGLVRTLDGAGKKALTTSCLTAAASVLYTYVMNRFGTHAQPHNQIARNAVSVGPCTCTVSRVYARTMRDG